MKNSNDNLKENAIKQEKAMDKIELENVSGGRGILPELRKDYWIDSDICSANRCTTAGCRRRCCHPNAIGHLYINNELCQHCFNCDAMLGCPYNAIKEAWHCY
jgi:TPP-dependent indolepyruvate ferredoxin oxidoreductase alpha subunit